MQTKLSELKQVLKDKDIPFEIIKHRPIYSVEEGLKELGIEANQGFSTLIMKADSRLIALVRRDDNKISFKKVKKQLGIKNLEFASREEVIKTTGCDFGCVSAYNKDLETYCDETLLDRDYIYGGTGSAEHDLKIRPKNLIRLTEATILQIV